MYDTTRPGSRQEFLRKTLLVALVAGVVFQIVTYFLSLYLSISLFYFTPEGLKIADRFLSGLFVYSFFVLNTFVPGRVNVGIVFLALWTVFLASLLISWRGPQESVPKVLVNIFKRPLGAVMKNYLFVFPVVASMLLLADVAITSFQESRGIATGSLNISDPFILFFSASYAAVFEEIGFRIIPLGLIVAAHVLWLGRNKFKLASFGVRAKLVFLAILYPEGAKKHMSLKRVESNGWLHGISSVEWGMIIVTAFFFGIAHVLSGAGWGPGKFTTTFIGGFTFGLMYLIYGAQASILLHWFFNFYLTVYNLTQSRFSEIAPLLGVVDGGIVTFGFAGWIALAANVGIRSYRSLQRRRTPTQSIDSDAQIEPSKIGMSKYCIYCGRQLPVYATYCNDCGIRQPRIGSI